MKCWCSWLLVVGCVEGNTDQGPPTVTTAVGEDTPCQRVVDPQALALCDAGNAAVVGLTGYTTVQDAIDAAAVGDVGEAVVPEDFTEVSGGSAARPLTVVGGVVSIDGVDFVDGGRADQTWNGDVPRNMAGGVFVSRATFDLRCSTVANNTESQLGEHRRDRLPRADRGPGRRNVVDHGLTTTATVP